MAQSFSEYMSEKIKETKEYLWPENQTKSQLRKAFDIAKDYFLYSDDRFWAWFYLIGVLLCIGAGVALMAAMGWWSVGFWAIITAKTLGPFLISMGYFALIVSGLVATYVCENYLFGKLSILWRNGLTKQIKDLLFKEEDDSNKKNDFSDINRFGDKIDNVPQRIQGDIDSFVTLTLLLVTDSFRSILSFGTFVGTLWVIGGALTIALLGLNIVIPGYLVWVAILVSLIATVITHFIGRSLIDTNKKAETNEANLRKEVDTLITEAENIKMEKSEPFHKNAINEKMDKVNETANEKLFTQTMLDGFRNFYSNIAGIVPIVCTFPLYVAGLIPFGTLMLVPMSYSQVDNALNLPIRLYELLTQLKASAERITELKDATNGGLEANPKDIKIKNRPKDTIKVSNLSIMTPKKTNSDSDYITHNLKWKFFPGQHVAIVGQTGDGKSTLFKAIAESNLHGRGKISLPEGKSLRFIPQTATFPYEYLKKEHLRKVLAYPGSVYTVEECENALRAVALEKYIPALQDYENPDWSNEYTDWSKCSGGERQRLSIARALLKDPDWLFMDETTAGLDPKTEERVFNNLKKTKATIISITQKESILKYHDKVLLFKPDGIIDITSNKKPETVSLKSSI
ncbi:MAG: ABC transporter ATP-binding protein/permease [Tatlockia sp.]|nr:ABC transporter ATP-binding protein/permease [Tatlockia sp.]